MLFRETRERWFGWMRGGRAVVVGLAAMFLALIDFANTLPPWLDFRGLLIAEFGDKAADAVLFVMAILVIFLRWITTSPIFTHPRNVEPPPSGVGPAIAKPAE